MCVLLLKDPKHLFRLYMALKKYREAAHAASVIARELQNEGELATGARSREHIRCKLADVSVTGCASDLISRQTDKPWWLGSVTVRTLDLGSRGRGFNSRSGRSLVVTTWIGDCLRTGKPSRYITNRPCQLSLPSLRGR